MVSDDRLIEVIEKQTEVNTKILEKLDLIHETNKEGFANTQKSIEMGFANTQKSIEMGFANTQKSIEMGFANTQKSIEMGFANTREGFANTQKSLEMGFANNQKSFDKLDNHLTEFKKDVVDKYADFHKTMIRVEVLMGVLVALGIAAVLNMFGVV